MSPGPTLHSDERVDSDRQASTGSSRRPGLADVPALDLTPQNQLALDHACEEMQGPPAWRRRKRIEAHGLIALAQIAPRLVVHHLDLRTELGAIVGLRDTPVPCMAPGQVDIEVASSALLAIKFPEAILCGPIPGTLPVRVIEPRHVFHSNVSYGERTPALCLGANVPRGFPLREIVLSAYGALTLQAISLDALDPAGVLNPEAAAWYQANPARVPLTTDPFLGWRGAGTESSVSSRGRSSQQDEKEKG